MGDLGHNNTWVRDLIERTKAIKLKPHIGGKNHNFMLQILLNWTLALAVLKKTQIFFGQNWRLLQIFDGILRVYKTTRH